MDERQKKIVELADEIEKAYETIRLLGGSMVVVTPDGEITLGNMKRGNANHKAFPVPANNDFCVLFN